MRTQVEILDDAKDLVIPNSSGHIRLGLELLLDIRQLLVEGKNARLLGEVSEARKKVEEERKKTIEEKFAGDVEAVEI